MFPYYGSKSKLIKYYPPPREGAVIEPFAGAAWYSVTNASREITLNDKYSVIYSIWKWLIGEATQEDLLNHRNFFVGEDIRDMDLRQEHKDLIGFCINRGTSSPCNIVQNWSCQVKARPEWASTTYFRLTKIAQGLPSIKHWKIQNKDYKELPDIEATWFIDPPYQHGGVSYKENQIDYKELAEWCLSRKGQVIVCENTKADWLPFKPLAVCNGSRHKTTESLWTNNMF